MLLPAFLRRYGAFLLFAVMSAATAQEIPDLSYREKDSQTIAVLATKLIAPTDNTSVEWRHSIVQSYESAYGSIQRVPVTWPALVRRLLACAGIKDTLCVNSSLEPIKMIGGIDKLPLASLYEVRILLMSEALIRQRILESINSVASPSPQPSQPTFDLPNPNIVAEKAPPQPAPAPIIIPEDKPLPLKNESVQSSYISQSGFVLLGLGLIVAIGLTVVLFFRHRHAKNPPSDSIHPGAIVNSQKPAQANTATKQATPGTVPAAVKVPPATPSPSAGIPQASSLPATPSTSPQADVARLAAQRLLDCLHSAETDVEPFLKMVESVSGEEIMGVHVDTVKNWHVAIKEGRRTVLEVFQQQNWRVELKSVTKPVDLSDATIRLMRHAAFFNALLHVQKKKDTLVCHWSRHLPSALVPLYWASETKKHLSDLGNSPFPAIPMEKMAITVQDNVRIPDEFFNQSVQQSLQA